MKTVLLIYDDPTASDAIALMLQAGGYRSFLSRDGKNGVAQAKALKPHLVLVDIGTPGVGSIDVCKQIRAAGMNTPLMVLSENSSEMEKVLLFEIGADDYVVKPFGARELLARIRALLRRSSPEEVTEVISFGNIEVDLSRRIVLKKDEETKLTQAEFNLLAYFLQNPGRVLSRDTLLNQAWGYESPKTRTVDAHVVRLRKKLEADSTMPRHFLTVYGVGYRFSL